MSETEAEAPKKSRDHWIMFGCLASFFIFPCLMVSPVSKMIQQWGAGGFLKKVDKDCKERLVLVHKGIELYAADNDEHYPPADRWIDSTWKYAAKKSPDDESESIFRCPDVSMTRTGDFGYGFNSLLSSKRKGEVADPDSTWLIFDSSNLKRNAAGDPKEMLPEPRRHVEGKNNNAITAGGTVKEVP
ncbi:MAG: hypothetical protein KF784_11855 [Fimbriimonadaceae bacterium]|nr:hypothetical protein [Fimbriimonadaceae bacterium]